MKMLRFLDIIIFEQKQPDFFTQLNIKHPPYNELPKKKLSEIWMRQWSSYLLIVYYTPTK